MYHLKAVFFMRWNTQKRNFKGIVSEMLLPALITAIGVMITTVKFDFIQSPSKIISADQMPLPNKILVNQKVIDVAHSDTAPQLIWNNFAEKGSDTFQQYYTENYGKNLTYDGIQDAVVKHAHTRIESYPWLYASFEAYQINRST